MTCFSLFDDMMVILRAREIMRVRGRGERERQGGGRVEERVEREGG